jgi:hypothetical protein
LAFILTMGRQQLRTTQASIAEIFIDTPLPRCGS